MNASKLCTPVLLVAATGLIPLMAASTRGAEMIYADYTANPTKQVEQFTLAGAGSIDINSPTLDPRGLAVDSLGNIYVTNVINNTVLKYPAGGGAPITLLTGLNNPNGLAIDHQGNNLYVADTGNNRILEVPVAGGVPTTVAVGLSSPIALALDNSGSNLYFANNGNNTIEQVPAAGGVTSLFATTLGAPYGLAFDSAGTLYASELNLNLIEQFTAPFAGTLFATGLTGPWGLVFDSTGKLYAAEFSGARIDVFNGGVPSQFAATQNSPVFLADPNSRVPEPASMVLLALSGASLFAFRRRTSATAPRNRLN